MNHLVKCLLDTRGYTPEWLNDINTSYHKIPSKIPEFCEKLDEYRRNGEHIVLATDFDMDGIMTGVIGLAGLRELGFNVDMYIPDTGAYGLDANDIVAIKNSYPDVKCIITGDEGVTAKGAGEEAKLLHIKMLVTDHHVPDMDKIPDAEVIVDPWFDTSEEYFLDICGAYVMYLCLHYYAEHYHPQSNYMVGQIERLKVFAGIGTMTDEMPLVYENRELVREAVGTCKAIYSYNDDSSILTIPGCETYREAFHGLFTILSKFNENGKLTDPRGLYEDFFNFYIGPTFNSIKRMHANVMTAYNVFFESPDISATSMDTLFELTEKRKRIVDEEFHKMMQETDQPFAPYIYITDASNGIKGLLAQKAMEENGCPTLVVSELYNGYYSGSGRSYPWFPYLTETANLDFVHPAGHETAFGVSIDGYPACQDLYNFLQICVPKLRPEEEEEIHPDIYISQMNLDADCGLDMDIFEDYLYEIEGYHPFGKGFPAPCIMLEFNPKQAMWSYVDKNHKHVRAVLPGGLMIVAFNQGDMFPNGFKQENMPDVTKVYGNLNFNYYNGNRTIQFIGTLMSDMNQAYEISEEEVFIFDNIADDLEEIM